MIARAKLSLLLIGFALVAALLSGCASDRPLPAVPPTQTDQISILGDPTVRWWGDAKPENFEAMHRERVQQLIDSGNRQRIGQPLFLALSGGGGDGAFGAGFLKGWTEAGDRPTPDVVTGVSAGALIAPFAFLGPEYDDRLREALIQPRWSESLEPDLFRLLLGYPSLTGKEHMEAILQRFYDEEIWQAIAEEHRQGRRLWIVTTNLDTARPVVWNIGAIATADAPGGLALFHDILRASASIPILLPPVPFEVSVNGETYLELHTDGGLSRQIFSYPVQLEPPTGKDGDGSTGKLYAILNGTRREPYQVVKNEILSIAERTVFIATSNKSLGDVYRLYLTSLRDHLEFYLVLIPENSIEKPEELFAEDYLRKLYKLGYEEGLKGEEAFRAAPPGFGSEDGEPFAKQLRESS